MTKLKTLKDLEKDKFRTYCFGCEKTKELSYPQKYVFVDELKQEAIKWVKEHRIVPFGSFCEFFNITEEELK